VLLQESHVGGLAGHFGVQKSLNMLGDHFFWPHMRRDVQHYVERCTTCLKAKSHLKPHQQFQMFHGKIYQWILFWDYLGLRGGGIPYLLSSIYFLKWLILFPATRAMMLHTLLICFLGRPFAYMEYSRQLFQIMIQNF
jgi:hypothetical protein